MIQRFTEEEIQRLLDACDGRTVFGCRNRAIILPFLDTGMRALELLRVEMCDVDWETRRIRIRLGKGRKQRVVAFGLAAGGRRRTGERRRSGPGQPSYQERARMSVFAAVVCRIHDPLRCCWNGQIQRPCRSLPGH